MHAVWSRTSSRRSSASSPPKRHAAELAADALHRALGAAAKDGAVRMEPSAPPHARRHERRRGLRRGRPARPRRRATRSSRSRSSCGPTPAPTARRAAARRRRCAAPATSRIAWASRTSRSTCASASGPRSWTRFLDGYAAGRTPNPCVRCNGEVRFDAMLELAERARRRPARHRPLRPHRPRRARPARPRGRRPAQGPELHARQARPRAARPAQLPARRPHQGRRARARARGRPPGGRQAREPGPLLRRRPRRPRVPPAPRRPAAAHARARSSTAAARCSAATRASTTTRSASAAASASRASEPLYVLEKDAEHEPRGRRARRRRSRPAGCRWRTPPSTALPREVETVRLRYHAEPLACRVHVQDDGSLELELDRPANGVAPGQLACLMRQDRVVGEGTIGEPR